MNAWYDLLTALVYEVIYVFMGFSGFIFPPPPAVFEALLETLKH